MGVTARTNQPGTHTYPAVTECHYSWGSDYWGIPEGAQQRYELGWVEHECIRSNKVVNNPRLLGPGGPIWRDPSGYYRSVVECESLRGTWRKEVRGLNFQGKPYYSWEQRQEIDTNTYLFADSFSEGAYALGASGHSWPSGSENAAIAKALDKLKNRSASLGEDLAEATKTYSTLTSEVGNLLYAVRAVRRGNFGLAAKFIRDQRGIVRRGADVYLQYQFGWKPLMQDIHGLVGLLQEQCKPAWLMSAHSGFPHKFIRLLPRTGYERSGGVKRTGHVKLTGKVNSSQSSLPDRIGLSNPLSLGWDLIPYSFVVDWVMPVGSVLDSMTDPLGLDFVGGYASARWSGEFSSTLLPGWMSGWEQLSPRKNTFRVFHLSRRKYDNWPKVGLYVKSPFSNSHGITSLALLIQKLRI